MNIQSAMSSGLQGVQRASAGVTEATLDINRQTQASAQARQQVSNQQNEVEQSATADNSQSRVAQTRFQPELTDSLVRLNVEERNAQANVKSIQTADQMLGSIIDLRV